MIAYGSPARILLVEDDPDIQKLVRAVLEGHGFSVTLADDGESGLSRAYDDPPDLVVLDVYMPRLDGFSVARQLQESERTRHVPIIFLTVAGQADLMVKGFELGAVDYVVKPFEPEVLAARVRGALRRKGMQDQLAAQAFTDSLTGLYNRRYLMETLAKNVQHAARYGLPLSCLILDLDHFKTVNDTHGHLHGDQVLKELAAALQQLVRSADTLGRYGGEEFLILCPSTGAEAGLLLGERIRQSVAERSFGDAKEPLRLTVSVGCAAYHPAMGTDYAALLARADAALYRAKQAGGDSVQGDSPSPPSHTKPL